MSLKLNQIYWFGQCGIKIVVKNSVIQYKCYHSDTAQGTAKTEEVAAECDI